MNNLYRKSDFTKFLRHFEPYSLYRLTLAIESNFITCFSSLSTGCFQDPTLSTWQNSVVGWKWKQQWTYFKLSISILLLTANRGFIRDSYLIHCEISYLEEQWQSECVSMSFSLSCKLIIKSKRQRPAMHLDKFIYKTGINPFEISSKLFLNISDQSIDSVAISPKVC